MISHVRYHLAVFLNSSHFFCQLKKAVSLKFYKTQLYMVGLSFIVISFILTGCAPQPFLRLATTTSLEQSGLLGVLIEDFHGKYHINVKVITTGTGAALELAQNGDADVVLVHAPEAEQRFMEQGFGLVRYSIIASSFIILGPEEDPAGISTAITPKEALKRIADYNTRIQNRETIALNQAVTTQAPNTKPSTAITAQVTKPVIFVSRGDKSGTDILEKALWDKADIIPDSSWYKELGQGMSEVILFANAQGSYTIADLPTWISVSQSSWFKQNYDCSLKILFNPSQDLVNIYSVIVIKNDTNKKVQETAISFAHYLKSKDAQEIINSFSLNGIQCYKSITEQDF